MKTVIPKTKTKRNYRWMYAVLKHIPGYTKGSEEMIIDSLVEQYTSYRTCSRDEMTDKEYSFMHDDLKSKYDAKIRNEKRKKENDERDMWRKRVLAAIHAYFERQNQPHPSAYVIGVFRQSSGYHDINLIPEGKLIAMYNFWNQKNDIVDRSKLFTINVN